MDPQNGWFIMVYLCLLSKMFLKMEVAKFWMVDFMENPKMDENRGVDLFQETSKHVNFLMVTPGYN